MMVELQPSLLIARGWHRECYRHPENPNRCIKIVVNGDDVETRREQAYYRFLQKRLNDWRAIPRFYGNIDTNLGSGAEFELVRDADGSVSRTLAHYLEDKGLLYQHFPSLISALKALYYYQLENNILTMSIKPMNLLLQHNTDGNSSIQIIDNLGNADFIPIANYFKPLGKAKIKRKWHRFNQALQQTHPELAKELSELEL